MEAIRDNTNKKTKVSLKTKIQQLGTNLSGMIMPNIAAIVAWGLIAALFMAQGWFPNAKIAELIDPMLHYMIPILIAYVGGRMVYEERGAVVGTIAVMGVIVGAKIPMFLGAMIMGPLGGWCMKKCDQLFQDKIKSGFEMIYNNFSSGILGMLLAILGLYVINPLVVGGSNLLAEGVKWIMSVHMLPLANIIIEPAKVLFLNNAIGNGILVPLGIQQAAEAGKSVLFLLESNPGPGLGILLAYMFFGKGASKASAPGAAIIQFFGGIHEIYFPYVLMKPQMLIAAILGGVAGTATFTLLDTGLKAAASPGSILAILLMTPKGNYLKVILGVAIAAAVSFAVGAILLKMDKSKEEDGEFADKQNEMKRMKAEAKGQLPQQELENSVNDFAQVTKIIFACDAGMGSSAMGASLLRDKVKKAGLTNISVTNKAISKLQDEPGLLVVTQEELADRALQKTPNAMHISVDNFMDQQRYDQIVLSLKAADQIEMNDKGAVNNHSSSSVQDNGIHYDEVQEIDFIHHDQKCGSATMATALFKDELKKLGASMPVKNVAINQVHDDIHHLAVVTAEVAKNLRLHYTNLQVLVVDDLLDTAQFDNIIHHFSH